MRSTFPRSSVLVLGQNSVQSLVPSTLISQVEALLDSHRIPDAIKLADAQRKKVEVLGSVEVDEAEELRYVYQVIGFRCFSETRFGEAFDMFFYGDLDPRFLVGYFEGVRGGLVCCSRDSGDDESGESEMMEVECFVGVVRGMPVERCVEDIIWNYSPYLGPSTREASTTMELKKILEGEAYVCLERFLKRWRVRKKVEVGIVGSSSSLLVKRVVDPALVVVDTVLVKLWASAGKDRVDDLKDLLREPNDVVLEEVEPVLRKSGKYGLLCDLYRERGEVLKLLDVLAKFVEGEWTDEGIGDPLSEIVALVMEKKDRALTQQWALWIMKHDLERGLKLLMPETSGKRREKPEEDVALFERIEDVDSVAGLRFLEYLVLQRRSLSRRLHTQFASKFVEELCNALSSDSVVSKLWRAKAASYASSPTDLSFLSYFASTTPDSSSKRLRIKTILFLAGSSLYDPEVVRTKIEEHEKVLKLELAILDGKLGNHKACLMTLVHDLHDASAAEAYCTLGGGTVVPVKVAQALAEGEPYLEGWVSTLFGGGGGGGVKSLVGQKQSGRSEVVDEGVKRTLLKLLLEVYMADADASKSRAAQAMIASQAMNLDVLDVISLVPPDWPLNLATSFLARSLRRTLHEQHEGKIVKTISAGQNLEVKERTWLTIREYGMIIEEAAEEEEEEEEDGDDEGVQGGTGLSYDEKGGLMTEKEMMVRMSGAQAVKREDVTVEGLGLRGLG